MEVSRAFSDTDKLSIHRLGSLYNSLPLHWNSSPLKYSLVLCLVTWKAWLSPGPCVKLESVQRWGRWAQPRHINSKIKQLKVGQGMEGKLQGEGAHVQSVSCSFSYLSFIFTLLLNNKALLIFPDSRTQGEIQGMEVHGCSLNLGSR